MNHSGGHPICKCVIFGSSHLMLHWQTVESCLLPEKTSIGDERDNGLNQPQIVVEITSKRQQQQQQISAFIWILHMTCNSTLSHTTAFQELLDELL